MNVQTNRDTFETLRYIRFILFILLIYLISLYIYNRISGYKSSLTVKSTSSFSSVCFFVCFWYSRCFFYAQVKTKKNSLHTKNIIVIILTTKCIVIISWL